MREYFGLALFCSWFLLAVFHFLFTVSWLYWYYTWLDIPMHFMGAVLLIATWFYFTKKPTFSHLAKKPFLHPVFLLILVIIAWEIFQLLLGKPISANYVNDTRTDLVMGLLGGIISYIWFSSRTISK